MKLFFDPETVALIGATENPLRAGYQLFLNMNFCFGEKFYPVNPKGGTIEGKTCYPSILDVPVPVDAAVIFINSSRIPEVLEQCGEKGIKRVIIESAGFSEAGPEGQMLNKRCLEIAHENDIRIWGPNCMGVINVHTMKVLSFFRHEMWREKFIPGSVSLVVQSGMLSAGFLTRILSRNPFGLSKICSIGNKMDVDESDILEYLISDPETEVIAMYLESVEQGRRFFNLCQSTQKPIVVLKAGRTAIGAQAAQSHTGSLAQNDTILDAALRQTGVIRVHDMNELIEIARCFGIVNVESPKRTQLAILTFSGGAGVVSSDTIYDYGMDLARFNGNTTKQLKTLFPEWMEPANPLDLYPAMEKNGYYKVVQPSLEAAIHDPEVDGIFSHFFAFPSEKPLFEYEKIGAMLKSANKPMVIWTLGDDTASSELKKQFEQVGVPVVDEISKGVRILSAILQRK